ncbi:MAG: accessory factor UbiK family protein [Rickettsiales bacterium]|nr:accessory factor UbiK family protein [Rickettsiales bacterium]
MKENVKSFFEDISKLSGNVAGVAFEAGKNINEKVKDTLKHLLAELDVVTHEEFEIVRKMAEKAREENEILKARIEKLESVN